MRTLRQPSVGSEEPEGKREQDIEHLFYLNQARLGKKEA